MLSQISFFIQEEVNNLSLQKLTHPSFSGLVSDFLRDADHCNVSDLTITISDFWHYEPKSVSIDGD